MLDVNRCLYLTSPTYAEKLGSSGTYLQNTLLDLCMLQPDKKKSEKQKLSHKKTLDMFEQQMKRNKLFDSGLSLAEERKALLYAMLQRLQQLRALIYYHIYSMCGH